MNTCAHQKTVDGTPADCVKMALTAMYKDWKPDVLISGYDSAFSSSYCSS